MKPRVRVVPIAQLVLDGKNANKGTKRGRELLEESLERYGAGRSVVVDRHHRVIAENKTVEAARAAGMDQSPSSKPMVLRWSRSDAAILTLRKIRRPES
jgi:hypothetical protein